MSAYRQRNRVVLRARPHWNASYAICSHESLDLGGDFVAHFRGAQERCNAIILLTSTALSCPVLIHEFLRVEYYDPNNGGRKWTLQLTKLIVT